MLISGRVCGLLLVCLAACSSPESNKDPVFEAKFQNEKRIGEEAITKRQIRDAEYVVDAASRKMLLLEISQLATRKAASPDTRYTAQNVTAQTTTLLGGLKALAQQKSITLPTGLSEAQGTQAGELTALNGAAFDQKYQEVLSAVLDTDEDAADNIKDDAYDADLRAIAAQHVTVLQDLDRAANALHDKLKP
ncbi:DUF4142 domain-containing protein [Hymenobacter endophyticus]|uniref:DUF4142 domain-containing protein n=1 Tax=Hymenobacter endophyticus TaxID=3076335 RepID=A0ABU3TH76_9BACT|nr:DUF4142 domain-containing protein [Hymenobacter endophyticus]MDU0370714.1 DUF4142 domain-containing protein [Hymenobacter endophyticus]